jgi:hypothetical protein
MAMTQKNILNEISKLSFAERLTLMESVLHSLREELQQVEGASKDAGLSEQLTKAAVALLSDYESDEELTAFTALDAEDFYA